MATLSARCVRGRRTTEEAIVATLSARCVRGRRTTEEAIVATLSARCDDDSLEK